MAVVTQVTSLSSVELAGFLRKTRDLAMTPVTCRKNWSDPTIMQV